jgi:hypothetical protein
MTPPAKSPDDLIWECARKMYEEREIYWRQKTRTDLFKAPSWDVLSDELKMRERAIWLASVGPLVPLFERLNYRDYDDTEALVEALCRAVKG